MNAAVGDSAQPDLGFGAARVALAALWCAAVPSPEVFATPRYRFLESLEVLTAVASARLLQAQVGAANVLRLTPTGWDGDALSITVTSVDENEGRSPGFGGLVEGPASRALLVAGGRGLRVSGAMLHQFDKKYRIAAPTSAGGSPPNDPWTDNLQLPPVWLDGVEFVLLLGRQEGNTSTSPVRIGTAFDATLVDDLY